MLKKAMLGILIRSLRIRIHAKVHWYLEKFRTFEYRIYHSIILMSSQNFSFAILTRGYWYLFCEIFYKIRYEQQKYFADIE
jgi:hypothetical protein